MAKTPSTTGTTTRKKKRTNKVEITPESLEAAGIRNLDAGKLLDQLPTIPKGQKVEAQKRKHRFIEVLARTGNVSYAAHAAGWRSRNTAYQQKEKDPLFAELWEEAVEISMDALEMEARNRALGWDEPIINKDGEVVGHRRVFSDKMMEILLKAHRPEKFREKFEHDHKVGGGVIVMPAPMSEADWEARVLETQRPHREVIEHDG
jgi:hypothetical protein